MQTCCCLLAEQICLTEIDCNALFKENLATVYLYFKEKDTKINICMRILQVALDILLYESIDFVHTNFVNFKLEILISILSFLPICRSSSSSSETLTIISWVENVPTLPSIEQHNRLFRELRTFCKTAEN